MKFKRECYFRVETDWSILANDKGNIISINKFATIIILIMGSGWIELKTIVHKLFLIDGYFSNLTSEYLEDVVLSFLNDMINEGMVVRSDILIKDTNIEKAKQVFLSEETEEIYFNSPLMSIVEITNRCNQKCRFCYVDMEKKGRIVDDPKLSDLFTICDRLIENNIFTINFLGGEPLLRFDDLICLIKYVHSKNPNIHCTFATNGSANGGITREKAHQLAKLENVSIRVSLHGYEDDHDVMVGLKNAYKTALTSLTNLIKVAPNILVSVAVTVSKETISKIEMMLNELFIDIGVEDIEVTPIQPVGQAINTQMSLFTREEEIEVMDIFNRQSEKWAKKNKRLIYGSKYNNFVQPLRFKNEVISCGIKHSIYIDTKGDCYVCHMSVGYNQFKIGNIYETEIERMWDSRNRKALIAALTPSEICKKCEVESCNNGCIVSAFINNGSLDAVDPCCPWINL